MTKISGVDAVLCGHLHKDFPNANGTKYDDYPGVNKTTGIVNGKPLVQIENRGASIGMVDLNIGTKNNKPTITGKSTQIRKVNASTEVDPTINAAFGNWTKTFMADSSQILSEVAADTQLQNYFGTMEDNDAIQLLNNIKTGLWIAIHQYEDTIQKSPGSCGVYLPKIRIVRWRGLHRYSKSV